METIWLEILNERLKRSRYPSITKYVQKSGNHTNIISKTNRNCINGYISSPFPVKSQQLFHNMKREKKVIKLKHLSKLVPFINNQNDNVDIWKGFTQFEKSYKKYSEGKF